METDVIVLVPGPLMVDIGPLGVGRRFEGLFGRLWHRSTRETPATRRDPGRPD